MRSLPTPIELSSHSGVRYPARRTGETICLEAGVPCPTAENFLGLDKRRSQTSCASREPQADPDVRGSCRHRHHGQHLCASRRLTRERTPPIVPIGKCRLAGENGGGGNRTRVRGRTEQNVYERSPCLISPAGRFTDDQPTGQPSFGVARQAIGSPFAPSPNVGAGSRISGRIRVDVALPRLN